jgi:hypothetical protein
LQLQFWQVFTVPLKRHEFSAVVSSDSAAAGGLADIPPQAIREQARRILADTLFLHSKRISDLLTFIVENSLEGHNENLKERIIGIEVFGRTPDFDSASDSAVRVAASQLRKRLVQYYAEPMHSAELRIEVPVGSYVAEAHYPEPELQNPESQPAASEVHDAPAAAAEQPAQLEEHRQKRAWYRLRWYVWLAAALLAAGLVFRGTEQLRRGDSEVDRFWTPLVTGVGPVMICVGSPLDPDWSSPISPALMPKKSEQPSLYAYEQRMNIGIMDLRAADALVAYLRSRKADYAFRPTFGTELADLRTSRLILYGQFLNDLEIQFGGDQRFKLRMDAPQGLRWIEDMKSPDDRKWSTDVSAPYEKVEYDYALISRLRDKSTGKWWAGIAGLTGVSTMAANKLLLDPEAAKMVFDGLPQDWDQKNLQIVVKVKMIQANPGEVQVVARASW